MRGRDIFNNIREKLSNPERVETQGDTEETAGQPETPPEAGGYFQWYEDDPDRLCLEQKKMEDAFSGFKCHMLNDARICFTKEIDGHELALICGYNYPKEPPEALLISGEALSSNLVSPDGSIDVFGSGNMVWDANTAFVVDIAKEVRTIIELFLKLQDKDSNTGDQDHGQSK